MQSLPSGALKDRGEVPWAQRPVLDQGQPGVTWWRMAPLD